MKIKKGDTVKILKGKDLGKISKVLRILPAKNKAIVENVNVYKKHVKGNGRTKESAIVDVVKPIEISNLKVICENCNEPTRVSYSIDSKSGEKVRLCKKCGKTLEKTSDAKKVKVETKSKTNVKPKSKDSVKKKVSKSTKKDVKTKSKTKSKSKK